VALYRFEWVTNEKGSSAKTLVEVQNRFTTKDTKSTKEDEAFDPVFRLGDIEVQQESGLLPFFVSFVVNSLRPPVLLHNRHPSRANRD